MNEEQQKIAAAEQSDKSKSITKTLVLFTRQLFHLFIFICIIRVLAIHYNSIYTKMSIIEEKGDKVETKTEKKLVTVYTDYGYGTVDGEKFKDQLEQSVAEHADLQQPILEYFKEQHASLKQKQEEVLAAKRAEEEAAKKKAEEEAKQKAAEEEAKKKAIEEEAKQKADAEEAKEKAAAEEAKSKAAAEEEKKAEVPDEEEKKQPAAEEEKKEVPAAAS